MPVAWMLGRRFVWIPKGISGWNTIGKHSMSTPLVFSIYIRGGSWSCELCMVATLAGKEHIT